MCTKPWSTYCDAVSILTLRWHRECVRPGSWHGSSRQLELVRTACVTMKQQRLVSPSGMKVLSITHYRSRHDLSTRGNQSTFCTSTRITSGKRPTSCSTRFALQASLVTRSVRTHTVASHALMATVRCPQPR